MMEQARKVFAEIQEARVKSGYEYWYAEEIAGGATEEDAETRAEYMVSQEPYSYSDPDHGHAYFCDIDPSPYIAPDGTKYLLFNRNETGHRRYDDGVGDEDERMVGAGLYLAQAADGDLLPIRWTT